MAETKQNNETEEELLTGYLGSFMVLESCSETIDVPCVRVNNGFFGIITTVEDNSALDIIQVPQGNK